LLLHTPNDGNELGHRLFGPEEIQWFNGVESKFAVDSTGFGTVTYRRWYDAKYGREMKQAGWIKAHAMVGTTTNVITAIRVTDCDANDSPELPALVASTERRFTLAEVSADKAYLSHANLAAIESAKAVPYIPFKSNSKGEGPAAWRRMWGLFMYKQADFLAHYHARSNVAIVFVRIVIDNSCSQPASAPHSGQTGGGECRRR
jgi:transposase